VLRSNATAARLARTRQYRTIPRYASITVFGDSVAAGTNASTTANRWANILSTATGGTLSNNGISGTVLQNSNDSGGSPRTSNGRDRFVADLTGANLKAAVFIAYGYNDARYTGAPATFNVTAYQADYREILNGLLVLGYARADIYVGSPYYITTTGLSTGSTGFTGQTRSGYEAFVTAAAAVAAEYGVNYCDLYNPLNDAAYTAEVDGFDNIHPGDFGHWLIAKTFETRTLGYTTTNTASAPSNVTGVAASGQITASCDPVAGATSYEFVPVASYVDGSTTTDADGLNAVLTVADGTYRVKARAVFPSGNKSPWGFAASDTVVASVFLLDNFVGTNGTNITAHSPDTGGSWAVQSGFSPATPSKIQTNRLYTTTSSGVYANGATPPSADYYVEAVLFKVSTVAADNVGVAARMQSGATTLYFARWSETAAGWQLFKTVAGASTQLGSTSSGTFAVSASHTLRLTCSGSTISASLDGSQIISVTDTDISTAGFAGVRAATTQSSATGIHIESITASI
jgi:lysophospholipase L1-like esterase